MENPTLLHRRAATIVAAALSTGGTILTTGASATVSEVGPSDPTGHPLRDQRRAPTGRPVAIDLGRLACQGGPGLGRRPGIHSGRQPAPRVLLIKFHTPLGGSRATSSMASGCRAPGLGSTA
jgi:hypothetical protein